MTFDRCEKDASARGKPINQGGDEDVADKFEAKVHELLGFLKRKVRGIISALHALGRPLKNRIPKSETSLFKDHERIEDAKYYPPVRLPPIDEGELPDSYGQPRVTLMVVNPYLVHAYWDVDLARLPPQTSSAVLRFHGASETSLPDSFEVDVDLRARNWYVHLWTPAKSYYADLGVKTVGSGFTSLARSNRIRTPRAWPAAEVNPTATTVDTPSGVLAEPVSRKTVERVRFEVPPRRDEIRAATITPQPYVLKPVDASEVLAGRLSEIYSLRKWRPRAAVAAPAAPFDLTAAMTPFELTAAMTPFDLTAAAAPLDLTALAEHQFSPGLSSALPASQTPERPPG